MIPCPNCNNPFEPKEYRIGSVKKKTIACTRSCARALRKHTDVSKQKLSNKAKSNPQGAILNASYWGFTNRKKKGPRVNYICKECNVVFEGLPSRIRKYCSNTCRSKNMYHPNSTCVHRSMYKGYQMDSFAELVLAKTLDENEIKWIKNDHNWKKWFQFEYKGKTRKYYPDFYLPDFDIWIEVKGKRYIRDGDDERRNSVGRPVLLFLANDFKKRMKEYIDLIRKYPMIPETFTR